MLSLNKAYEQAELAQFHQECAEVAETDDIAYVIEPKIDGMAISLVYENGQLTQALSRGNGREGDDLTANIIQLESIPRMLVASDENRVPELIELRGELFVTFADFEEVNRQREASGLEPFSHPRSYAAGSAKLEDSDLFAERPLSISIFGYGAYLSEKGEPNAQSEFYAWAKAWGLPVISPVEHAIGLEGLKKIWKMKRSYPFPSDGLVVKVDDRSLQRKLGDSASAPNWALACKFASQQVRTRVKAIELQIGQGGKMTPVAMLEPVELTGSRIERVTLHNLNTVSQLDVRIGDSVFVEKAGQVVPAIASVDLAARSAESVPFAAPENCPACGQSLALRNSEPYCPSSRCPAQLRRRIERFASSSAAKIDGLGPIRIAQLVERGILRDIADVYQLSPENLQFEDGSISASDQKLLAAIEQSKQRALWRYVYGIGLPQVGPARAKALSQAFGSLEAIANMHPSDFEKGGRSFEAGLGPSAQQAILDHLANQENRAELLKLLELGVRPTVDN